MARSRSRSPRSRSRSRSRRSNRKRSRSSPRRSRSPPSRSPRRRGRGSFRAGSRSGSARRSPSRRRQRVASRSRSRSGASSDGESRGRIWVAHTDCARIIGRRGEARKEIEQSSEAQLRIQREEDMDAGKKERYIELLGNLRQRRKATELIMKIATFCRDDRGKVLKDGQVGGGGGALADSILIQPGEVGRVLGRGGENIRHIEEESGARLELDKSEGRLSIRGPPDAVVKAREMVLNEVSHARDGFGTVIKDDQRGQGNSRGPGGDMRGDSSAPMVLWVAGKEAGRIIGKGGENLRDLQQRSGAEVKVARGDGRDDAEREVKVFGSASQKEEALLGLASQVSFVRAEQGVIKAPEMSPQEAEACLRRYANGGGVMPPMGGPWGPPMGMMPAQGMMPGMVPPGMMPGMMPGMPPMAPGGMLHHGPPGMMPGMMPRHPDGSGDSKPRGRSRSCSSSPGSPGKQKKSKASMVDPWANAWQASADNISFPTPWNEEKKSIDWDEL